MGFTLRNYQEEGTQACVDILKSTKKTCKELVISPTAGGKSIYVAETVKRVNAPILVLQPSKELLLQNYEKFMKVGGEATICCASLKTKTNKGVDYTQLEDGTIIDC
jgi:DNA repair protein RadD